MTALHSHDGLHASPAQRASDDDYLTGLLTDDDGRRGATVVGRTIHPVNLSVRRNRRPYCGIKG